MTFLLLIFDDEAAWARLGPAEMDDVMRRHGQLRADLEARGQFVRCDRLRPRAEAATVTLRDGAPTATDGPYAESKEIVGGFYLVDCGSKAVAVEWAKRIPLAGRSRVEVRPIWTTA